MGFFSNIKHSVFSAPESKHVVASTESEKLLAQLTEVKDTARQHAKRTADVADVLNTLCRELQENINNISKSWSVCYTGQISTEQQQKMCQDVGEFITNTAQFSMKVHEQIAHLNHINETYGNSLEIVRPVMEEREKVQPVVDSTNSDD